MGSTKNRMLFTEPIGRESQSNEFPELEPFKMAGEELIEYLPYIYHPKIDIELEKSYQKVKRRTFAYDTKNKCQIKRPFFNSVVVSCFRHFVSEVLPTLPNTEWKRRQSFQNRMTPDRTHWNSSSDSGSSTVGPNESAKRVRIRVSVNTRSGYHLDLYTVQQ